MNYSNTNSSIASLLSNNTKVQALEFSLQQSLEYFKDLLLDFEHLHVEAENYKTQFQLQKEKCEMKTCTSSDDLKKDIESKNSILQSLASTLTRLYETKDLNLINEAFQIIRGEVNIPQPDIKSSPKTQESEPDKENDESFNIIEGTPTGRISPIIHTKKTRSIATTKSSDFRDKKKYPDSWETPEKKSIKIYPHKGTSPSRTKLGGRLKQTRLNLSKLKQTNIVDLTCSPEFAGGLRTARTDVDNELVHVKRELIDSDDTILPSPTSGSDQYTLFKSNSISKASPFKKPQLSLKPKSERSKLQFEDVENKPVNDINNVLNNMEESINILQHIHKRQTDSPRKQMVLKQQSNDDTTYCETDMSVSLLQNVNDLNEQDKLCSPSKRPLVENKNILNTPPKVAHESTDNPLSGIDNVKRCIELVEPLYKEPTLRKKIEKRALPGWSCDDCKRFYGALHSDDPVMLARKIEECSKHRGKHNPVRPKTPLNFWNPRWNVPEDTEELNRMNNAV